MSSLNKISLNKMFLLEAFIIASLGGKISLLYCPSKDEYEIIKLANTYISHSISLKPFSDSRFKIQSARKENQLYIAIYPSLISEFPDLLDKVLELPECTLDRLNQFIQQTSSNEAVNQGVKKTPRSFEQTEKGKQVKKKSAGKQKRVWDDGKVSEKDAASLDYSDTSSTNQKSPQALVCCS